MNAGGLIRLAGLYIGLSEQQINEKIRHIESTTAVVLRDAQNMPSAYEAGVAYAKSRIDRGRSNKKATMTPA